ncbi:metallophosphoesterase [Corallococcus macrosporus]|uniref:Metallophosphatase n=2 Tax=Myxococcaceae TaxID=31 RepID=A0A286NVK8_9BACT|nr:metallophosphoesterase [Corallococcus macrosporus]AEI64028.1 putative bis(5'-nucleosyl)-tetraphosphatase, symmetrical [Corallococcus macrosporus]ATB51203.1 metallophosphatase [Corallococcus macrosporus DSM 14697]
MRTLFIGDVHGCAEELDALLTRCGWRPDDRVVLVGDLVAKGPDSAGVVRRAREQGFLAVRGNHDAHVLRWHAGRGPRGKKLKPEHQHVLDTLTPEDWAWLESQPLYRCFPELNVVAVHGGLVPGVPLEAQKEDELLNLRSIMKDGTPSKRVDAGAPWASLWQGPELVIFGHDAMRGLQRYPHAVGLDSGCVYGGKLSAYVMPEGRLVSVLAKRAYVDVDAS